MKKLTALLLVVILLVSACVFNTSAALKPLMRGDINDDWNVDVIDVTMIQRILAQLDETSRRIEYIGDVDGDGYLSVFDATSIQMWMAGLISDEEIDVNYLSTDIYVHDGYADYESGKAMAGVPVTFTVDAESSVQPLTYSLYVNFEHVTSSESGTITYTFEQAGHYYVEIFVMNLFNGAVNHIVFNNYEVVEPYEYTTPEITTAYITGKHVGTVIYGQDDMRAYVEAKGGVAPYQYKFELTRPKTCEYDSENVTITQDFSEKNYIELENINYDDFCTGKYHATCRVDCTLNITVKDANGDETTKTMYFNYSYDYPIG